MGPLTNVYSDQSTTCGYVSGNMGEVKPLWLKVHIYSFCGRLVWLYMVLLYNHFKFINELQKPNNLPLHSQPLHLRIHNIDVKAV